MRQMSHQTGTQIAETIKMTTARRSGPATPKPRPATGRSTTPTCVGSFQGRIRHRATDHGRREGRSGEMEQQTEGVPLDVVGVPAQVAAQEAPIGRR